MTAHAQCDLKAPLRALVTARQLKGSSRRLRLTSLWVYTVAIFSQAELRTRMCVTLDGTVLQDLRKPLYPAAYAYSFPVEI